MYKSLKRNIIISIICSLFLLHPNITKQALGLFEWINVGDNDLRMRMHMDYEWYSINHLKWIWTVGVPSIIIWVAAVPVSAFIILFKNRDKLEEEGFVKKPKNCGY